MKHLEKEKKGVEHNGAGEKDIALKSCIRVI